jgi:hypothetical protein
MRLVLTIAVGAAFTALLLGLPAAHAIRWSRLPVDAWLLVGLALPWFALMACLVGRHPAWPTLGFPVSHLPLVMAVPELTDARIYGGLRGLLAVGAIAGVGVAWLAVTLGSPAGGSRPKSGSVWPHPFGTGALFLAIGIFGAFAAPTFESGIADRWGAVVSLVVGLIAVWYAVGHLYVGRLGQVVFDRHARARYLGDLYAVERRRRPKGPRGLP